MPMKKAKSCWKCVTDSSVLSAANEVSPACRAASCTKAEVRYSCHWGNVVCFLILKRILNTSSLPYLPRFASDQKELDNHVTYGEENIYNIHESKTFSGLNGRSLHLPEHKVLTGGTKKLTRLTWPVISYLKAPREVVTVPVGEVYGDE